MNTENCFLSISLVFSLFLVSPPPPPLAPFSFQMYSLRLLVPFLTFLLVSARAEALLSKMVRQVLVSWGILQLPIYSSFLQIWIWAT